MTRLALILCVLLSAEGPLDPTAALQAATGSTSAPAAIVARLTGQATVQAHGEDVRPLRLFDRLAAGAMVQTLGDGEVLLVFRAGERVHLGRGSRGRVTTRGLDAPGGTVTHLTSVSPVPFVAPIRSAGTTITAVRIRAAGIEVIGPAHGVTTLADHTVLRFTPVAAATAFEIAIERADATVVHRARSTAAEVAVPAGILQPGTDYHWTVQAQSAAGFAVSGAGHFSTLTAEATAERARLHASLGTADGAAALLAEVDWTLGLWREALDGFRRAEVDNAVIADRIAEIERRLAGRPATPREP